MLSRLNQKKIENYQAKLNNQKIIKRTNLGCKQTSTYRNQN